MLSFLKKKKTENKKTLLAFATGKIVPIEQVNDPTFSEKILGDGLAIIPEENIILSPGDGTISTIMAESKHAVGIALDNGMEILIHEGLDTVSLKGEGFSLYVKEGQKVKTGDKLLSFNRELLKEKGLEHICIMVITNSMDFEKILFTAEEYVQSNKTVIAEI